MKLKTLFVFFLSVIIFNCSDEPTSVGINLLEDDLINLRTANSVDDSLTQRSSYFHEKVSLGSAGRLLLGKSENIDASLLIKFQTSLTDSLKADIMSNNIIVNNAVMEFYQNYRFGEELAPFDFTVHKVTSDWTVEFTEDSISILNYEMDDLVIQKEINDSVTSVTLNNQFIKNLLNIAADTSLPADKGLYLKPTEGTARVLGYQALTSSFTGFPVIIIIIEKPGVYIDTVSFVTTSDVSVVQGTEPSLSNENIALRSGFVMNSKLFFDVSKISQNVIVNSAELVLTVDTVETKVGTDFTNSLNAFFLFDSTKTDSISGSRSLGRAGNKFSGDITAFVRQWVNGNNHGLLLSTGNPLSGVELFSIRGSNASSIIDRPFLKITYTELK